MMSVSQADRGLIDRLHRWMVREELFHVRVLFGENSEWPVTVMERCHRIEAPTLSGNTIYGSAVYKCQSFKRAHVNVAVT